MLGAGRVHGFFDAGGRREIAAAPAINRRLAAQDFARPIITIGRA